MSQAANKGPKVGFFGPMKSPDSAESSFEQLPNGQLHARIWHETMHGVTPRMVRWWFENSDTSTHFNGQDFTGPPVPVYRLWHPYDHIRCRWSHRVYDESGRLAPGSVIEIEENLGARYPVRAKARVTKFDDSAFNFDVLLGGLIPAGYLLHEYAETEGGCSFYTEMLLGRDVPLLGRLANALARRFAGADEDFVRAWIVHNIEESGETEKFVPKLYEHAMASHDSNDRSVQ